MSKEKVAELSARRWVVKIGSALLTDNGCGLKHDLLTLWVKQIAALVENGMEFVIVSSGAVAEGITRLNWKGRPTRIHELQAAAAVGQMGLIQAYETCFKSYGKHTAQILLTHDDVSNRARYLNARTSLNSLIKLGVIPIVNENDAVATDEIRFGDNDRLAGLVVNLIDADLLVLMTDQKGLYTADPRKNASARLVERAQVDDAKLEGYAGNGGNFGRGGMRTKLQAARIAARSGAKTVIVSGYEEAVLSRLAEGQHFGTLLYGANDSMRARKQWLANQSHSQGSVSLDDGAVSALREQGKSLLPIGIRAVHGDFKRGEIVTCLDGSDREVARGLTNYASEQARLIMGKSSDRIRELLGEFEEEELIHRDNMILI